MIKKNSKFNKKKYICCNIRLYNKYLKYDKKILELLPYKMYNSLSINNLFVLNNVDWQINYLAKFVNIKDDNYILNLYEIDGNTENRLNIAYNDKRFVITKIRGNELLYNMTSKDFNNFIDKGISLLPFSSNVSNYNYSNNLYEYLLEGYSSFLNLCGNFDLVNAEKEKYLINIPFSFCCNFDQKNLYFIIQNLIDKENNENIQLYFLIILKQIVCALYNSENMNEEIMKDLIPYFKKLIMKDINSKENKLFNKFLNEIIDISSYIKNNEIIQINEIKFDLEKDFSKINYKSKFLLIELFLKQNKIQKPKELYEYIIQLEKNYLLGILNIDDFDKNNASLDNYYLFKQLMINASEMLYKSREKIKNELISFIPCLTENIQLIAEKYEEIIEKKVENNPIEKFSFIYNSFIFRSFYFIIENLIANKICLKTKESIISIYKTILILDKININISDCFDMNNIIEIRNYSFSRNDIEENRLYRQRNIKNININLEEPKDIIIKSSILSNKELLNSIKIKISYDNIYKNKKINLESQQDYIYHNVFEINIDLLSNNIINKNEFVINIIPLKDEKAFNLYKNNEDIKIISLIQKAIIHYLLFIFEEINSQIDKYNNDQNIKNLRKIFQTELFKFMSIPLNQSINNFINIPSPFNDITNQLLEKLNETIDNTNDFSILNNDLIDDFKNINKKISQKKFDFLNKYDSQIRKINKEASYRRQENNSINELQYKKLFNFFNYDLSKNNRMLNQIKSDDNLDSLINRIFLFGIKYYNCFEKLDRLQREVEKYEIKSIEDIKKYINDVRLIENYNLFYSLYKASSEIKNRYNRQKNKFNDSTFDEDKKTYFNDNLKKIEFLYNSIIPSDDVTIQPNISIIKNLINLIDNDDIGIYEIKKYSEVQNINSQIKLIELSIINNLLLYLNNEDNIILLLNLISKKIRNAYNKLNSFFDNTYGADYFIMEKLKYQFHLLLNILSDKNINTNQYSIVTKISLTESLMWKIRGRNFPILLEIMKVFKDIKNSSPINNDLFILEKNNIYNVNYYNERKNFEIKVEVFKILVYQIIDKIKDILKYQKENENKFQLGRNPSNAANINYDKILKDIFSYFTDIEQNSIYYNEIILFFYKIFINSDILLDHLLMKYPNVISKILEIAFSNEENIKMQMNNKLIMLKLMCQIIEKINKDNLDDFLECINDFEKNNLEDKNPLIYLYEKILIQINNEKEKIIVKYYINILLLCLNKISEIENDEDKIKNLIKDNMYILNILLLNDNITNISENKFIIKDNIHNTNSFKFEEASLFTSINKKSNKIGKIICFLDDDFNFFINNYNNSNIYDNYFDKSSINSSPSNANNQYTNIFSIMDDYEQFDINNLEIKYLTDIEILKDENKYVKFFISNNSELLTNIIKEELKKNSLNEKGLYFILKILSDLIKYMNKEDLIIILKYLWDFYDKNKLEESNYVFMSLEYIEDKINKYLEIFTNNNIYKKNDIKNNSLYSLFNYIIKDDFLEINLNQGHITKSYKEELNNPFSENKDYNNTKVYEQKYKLTDLSFYLDDKDYKIQKIGDNSILFTNLDLQKIINLFNSKQIINKIKVIILNGRFKFDIDQTNKFINKYNIPIYTIGNNIFKKLIDYFIGGIGVNYIYLYKDNNFILNNYRNNIFDIYQLHIDNNIQKIDEKEDNINKKRIKKIKNRIKNNPSYKTRLCYMYEDNGYCNRNENCPFAHGEEEIEEVYRIQYEMTDEYKEKEKKEKNKNNINKIYNDLKDESKKIFNILNIKLSKRLIYDIIYFDFIKLSELENIFTNLKNVLYIYEVLCMEYYFNISQNISTELLKKKLIKYLRKFANVNEINILNNEWIKCCFDQIDKLKENNIIDFRNYLLNYNISKLNNEKKLLENFYSYPYILYDKLLFLYLNYTNKKDNEYFIKYFFNIFDKIIKKISSNYLNYYNNNKENYESLFLSKIVNIIYEHFLNKNDYSNTISNNIIIEESFIPKNVEETMKTLMNNTDIKALYLFHYIIKYLDLCLILFLRENKNKYLEYLINSKNRLFNIYCDYKILTLEKYYKEKDYKEMAAFILYLVDSSQRYNKEINKIKNKDAHFKMKIIKFNEYKFNVESPFYDVTIKNIGTNQNDIYNYNKLAIFCLDEKNKKYNFQDIIDFNSLRMNDNRYNLRIKNNMHLVPLKNISTCLYSFENKSNSLNSGFNNINSNFNSDYKNLSSYEEIPKYSWNIGYDGNKYLLLSKEDNQIYSFNEEEKYSQKIKADFNVDMNLKNINKENNKIIDFIGEISNGPSLLYAENNNIFCLGNKYNYRWLSENEKQNIEYPFNIPNIKILSISANYFDCYVISVNGDLYENKAINIGFMETRQWIKINLPENCKKFLQCACGDGYLICLIQDNNGKGQIYVKGRNDAFQCGISGLKNLLYGSGIPQLTKCQIKENLDFKSVHANKSFSAAVTTDGKLYVWGLKDNNSKGIKPTFINNNKESTILVDKIYLNYGYLFALGRILEKGNYIRKIFSLEYESNLDSTFILNEIKVMDIKEDNSRIIPIKILIRKNKTYCLCINENKLIEEIKESSNKIENNYETEILINYNIQFSKEETNLEDLRKKYSSNNLNNFINLYNSLSDKSIQKSVKAFHEIKQEEISIEDIMYEEFINYLKGNDEMNELLSFFLSNEKSEGKILFDYLKIRIHLIEQKMHDYIDLNNSLKSDGFLQKIITNNIVYLDDNLRITYFDSLLLNLREMNNNRGYQPYNMNQRKKNITIDRFVKANNFKEKYNEKKIPDVRLKETVFGQLFHYYEQSDGKDFLLKEGERLFTVELKEERASDAGGPYREIFSNICEDLQSDYIELFIRTPNNKNGNGELRDKYIINPNAKNNIYLKAYEFIGKMMGLAISTKDTLNFNFHPIIWKSLLENKIYFEEYKTVDNYFFILIQQLEVYFKNKDENSINIMDLNFVIKNSNDKDIELKENGQKIKVTINNVEEFLILAKKARINEINEQIKNIKKGLYSVIEGKILKILNWKQLELMVCGCPIFDITDFKNKTIYKDYNMEEKEIKWFWEWLEKCNEEDKFKYLKFVSGYSRLPNKKYKHIIIRGNGKNKLPTAHTCFFQLDLPEYDSDKILFEKLQYAIENIGNITDA